MYLKTCDLTKKYGDSEVLSAFSMETGCGVYRISGPSGSGKTTLLRIILGLEEADSGTVDTDARSMAAVFQEDRLLDHEDAEGNLRFTAGKSFDPVAASALLRRLGLDMADRKPVRQYSGGMKRRLALARAILSGADLLALDEPLSGLDPDNVQKATEIIEEYAKDHIVLLVSHVE